MQPQRQHMWHREQRLRTDLLSRSVRLCDPAPRSDASRTPAPRHQSENGPSRRATPCATPDGQRIHDAPGSTWDRVLRVERESRLIIKMFKLHALNAEPNEY